MASFIEGFARGFSDARDRSLKREMFLGDQAEKRRAIAEQFRSKAPEQLQRIEQTTAKLEYLKNVRGLPDDRIAAFAEDPDVLNAAYEFATSGKGVDMSNEELSEIYTAVPLGDIQPGQNPLEMYNSQAEIYRDMIGGGEIDLNAFSEPVRPRQYSVEVRMPEKPEDLGVSAIQDRTWKAQQDAFDKAVLTFANNEITSLDQRMNSGEELSEKELTRLSTLNQYVGEYGSSEFANTQLRNAYGEQAKAVIMKANKSDPNFLTGFETNPLIFDYGEEARDEVMRRIVQMEAETPEVPEGAVLTHQGVDPADNRMTYFYRLPDGSPRIIKD